MTKQKHVGMTVEEKMLKKFYYIAKYYGRSGNGQMSYLVNSFINEFEKEHGKITEEDLKEFGLYKES